jgi:ketosteroid isomerase-like protein
VIDEVWARQHAEAWIAAWNAHDLDAIVAPYAEDVEFRSPFVVKRLGDPQGRLRGKDAVRDYFSKGLAALPDLRFELRSALVGVDSVAIHYDSVHDGRDAIEVHAFDGEGRIVAVRAHYAG